MMALNSELQFSQGTIGALKGSMKDVRVQSTRVSCVHAHVCIFITILTTSAGIPKSRIVGKKPLSPGVNCRGTKPFCDYVHWIIHVPIVVLCCYNVVGGRGEDMHAVNVPCFLPTGI